MSDSAIKIVSLCSQALATYTHPDTSQDVKRDILAFYFGKVVWDGKKLTTELSELAELVISLVKTASKAKQKVEPQSDLSKNGLFSPSRLTWQG